MRCQCTLNGNLKYPTRRTLGRYAEILLCAIDTRAADGLSAFVNSARPSRRTEQDLVHNPKLEKAVAPLGPHFHPGHYQRAVEALSHLSITDAIT
jgi:hypothetical protein